MVYELFIALRYLKAKRRHAFISLISWMSIGGVALGVTALIVVLSVMSGFEIDLRNKMLGITSHIVVQKFGEKGVSGYKELIGKITKLKGVTEAAAFVQGQVMISSGNNGATAGVVIHGIDPDTENGVTDLNENIKEGDLKLLKKIKGKDKSKPSLHGVILGKELFKNLGSHLGQELTIISPLGRMTPGGIMPKMKKFRVAGYFDSGMYEYDSNLAFISLSAAQKFFKLKDNVTGIEVKVEDIFLAQELSNKIQVELDFPYYARSWMEMNKTLFAALKREKVIMFMILTLIILVAAFNIASALIMVVMEKTKEVGVLKSMGATQRSILSIFTFEGFIIGSAGATLGILGGVIIVHFLSDIESFLESVLHTKVFPSDVYYLDKLPAHIETSDIIFILVATLLICLGATLYPAWKASKIDPVEALRYE